MADLNKIFGSNLTENEKKSKSLFGKLIISLRQNNHMRLYALLGNVLETKFDGHTLTLAIADKATFDMLNNPQDHEKLIELLNQVEEDLDINLECLNQKQFDMHRFEEFLRSEFKQILTIKTK